ncbi:uncharacterized protein CCOS01_08961 [Colletotrichum costaricense]|uniref:Uncharacterized protein n=1 Tax=Colletotrichum costaricense TaxID=1209916 RepID=A0AAJ0DYL1_9PEZI|nr:uncharacterized protein CCOS01_08961 [Colletotrichum costaricense]KAK1523874.1 hypothetical protein CCOS01_08961 [Colletotrichum costaricense]
MGINNPNVRRASDPPPIFAVGRTRSAILAAKLRLLKSACGVYTLFTLKRSNDGEAELQTDDAKDAERREGGTSAVLSNGPFPIKQAAGRYPSGTISNLPPELRFS